jgi:hypothetical protein
MHQPLYNHFLSLKDKRQRLQDSLTRPNKTALERQQIETQIELINRALGHYCKAFEIECQLEAGEDRSDPK